MSRRRGSSGGDVPDQTDVFLKREPPLSPPSQAPFSRCSSNGSLTAAGSSHSAPGTDDEDSDGRSHTQTYKERRREAHTFAEQKRRDAIKKGYDMLQELVPTCHAQEGGSGAPYKMSKAAVLQKSIEYTQYLLQQKRRQEEELASLRKEAVALQILKANYDQVVKAHQNRPGPQDAQVSDEVKFQVFRAVIDSLFQSFEASVSTSSFAELSGSMIAWMEEDVKPQVLRDTCIHVLRQIKPNL
ncbi:max-like protein X [Pollicipes pollicipes]|uniref:max-like protein X n=1 Tax=Pollicipes pollicipes TaxID=41117 RepID=UPI0018859FF4|nr:max-like protein X [Pollicipes pollicipes]